MLPHLPLPACRPVVRSTGASGGYPARLRWTSGPPQAPEGARTRPTRIAYAVNRDARLSWGGLPRERATTSAQPGPMHVIYMSVPTGINAAHRTDSHGHCPQNRLTCANQQAEPCAPKRIQPGRTCARARQLAAQATRTRGTRRGIRGGRARAPRIEARLRCSTRVLEPDNTSEVCRYIGKSAARTWQLRGSGQTASAGAYYQLGGELHLLVLVVGLVASSRRSSRQPRYVTAGPARCGRSRRTGARSPRRAAGRTARAFASHSRDVRQ